MAQRRVSSRTATMFSFHLLSTTTNSFETFSRDVDKLCGLTCVAEIYALFECDEIQEVEECAYLSLIKRNMEPKTCNWGRHDVYNYAIFDHILDLLTKGFGSEKFNVDTDEKSVSASKSTEAATFSLLLCISDKSSSAMTLQ